MGIRFRLPGGDGGEWVSIDTLTLAEIVNAVKRMEEQPPLFYRLDTGEVGAVSAESTALDFFEEGGTT